MRDDPLDSRQRVTIERPPARGPGSGKDSWVRYAGELEDGYDKFWTLIEEQSETIRQLNAEVELLRQQIASRKPKGGRDRLKDQITRQIELELASGLYSRRQIAVRNAVSPMTVTRIARRVAERERVGG